MNKMDRDGGNETQRLYRSCSNYALSKLITENGLEDLWRKENPDSPDFPRFDRFSDTRSRIDRVYTDKIANNTNINHIIVSFTDHTMLFLLKDSPQKLKLEKIHGTLTILFFVTSSSPHLQRICFFIKTKKATTLQQVSGGYTPNLVLKRMLEHFLKNPSLKKILEFQD